MMGLVVAEVRKLTSVVTTWVLTGLGMLLVVLGSALFLFLTEFGVGEFLGTDPQVAFVADQVGGANIIVVIVALLSMTTEFRHGTIGRTLQITPGRTRLLVAKLVAGTIYALGFLVLGLAVGAILLAIAAAVNAVGLEIGGQTLTSIWQGAVGLTLTAWFGVALGALLRSQVVAITLTLVWSFVVEPAFGGLLPAVGKWLPFNALNAVFVGDEAVAAMGEMGPQMLDPLVGLSVFIGYGVVAAVAAVWLLRTRDV